MGKPKDYWEQSKEQATDWLATARAHTTLVVVFVIMGVSLVGSVIWGITR